MAISTPKNSGRSGAAALLEDAARVCAAVDFGPLDGADILVTGASGLIGSSLLACLVRARASGLKGRVRAQHLSALPAHVSELIREGGFEPVRADLSRPEDCARLPAADAVIHGAGCAQPAVFTAAPLAAVRVNVLGTLSLLERLRPGGRFLFLSSTELYAGVTEGLLGEDGAGRSTPYHPRAGYIEGKRCGEAVCGAFRARGARASSARLGLTYGPGTRPGDQRALNAFIRQALDRGRIELKDAGTAVRTYAYVSDAVELLWRVLLDGREAVYNVGGRSTLTIAELAGTIARLTGAELAPPPAGAPVPPDHGSARLDLSRVEAEFGKTRCVGLEEGLSRTIAWQRLLRAGALE